ncbi:hypothetical protein ACFOS0_20140 [Nocardia seriolae]|uniref:hypothetical protein n=1 Tax=Nocardia seriolae TaxID=37332 RepID=UPI0011935A2F|nr:hypothetical protein [Nocardia seriolae]GEM27312.1 hypothetical protein NS2_55510 [Nocardia seriolae NBRC 15557]
MAEWISVYCREPILLDGDEIRRRIEIADLWTWAETLYDEEELAEAAAESVLANLRIHADAASAGPGPGLIRGHLAAVRHVINIEMSAADSTSMGAVLGEIVALELAAAGDGLVWFFGKDWVSPEDRAGTVWTSS